MRTFSTDRKVSKGTTRQNEQTDIGLLILYITYITGQDKGT